MNYVLSLYLIVRVVTRNPRLITKSSINDSFFHIQRLKIAHFVMHKYKVCRSYLTSNLQILEFCIVFVCCNDSIFQMPFR